MLCNEYFDIIWQVGHTFWDFLLKIHQFFLKIIFPPNQRVNPDRGGGMKVYTPVISKIHWLIIDKYLWEVCRRTNKNCNEFCSRSIYIYLLYRSYHMLCYSSIFSFNTGPVITVCIIMSVNKLVEYNLSFCIDVISLGRLIIRVWGIYPYISWDLLIVRVWGSLAI